MEKGVFMGKRFFVYSLSALLILGGITLLVSKSDNFLSQPLQGYTCPSASNYQNLKSSVADSLCDKLKAKYATDTAEKPWLSLIEGTFEKREAKKFREGMKVSSAMFAYMKDGIRLVIDLKNKPVDEEGDTLKEIDEIGNSTGSGANGSGVLTPPISTPIPSPGTPIDSTKKGGSSNNSIVPECGLFPGSDNNGTMVHYKATPTAITLVSPEVFYSSKDQKCYNRTPVWGSYSQVPTSTALCKKGIVKGFGTTPPYGGDITWTCVDPNNPEITSDICGVYEYHKPIQCEQGATPISNDIAQCRNMQNGEYPIIMAEGAKSTSTKLPTPMKVCYANSDCDEDGECTKAVGAQDTHAGVCTYAWHYSDTPGYCTFDCGKDPLTGKKIELQSNGIQCASPYRLTKIDSKWNDCENWSWKGTGGTPLTYGRYMTITCEYASNQGIETNLTSEQCLSLMSEDTRQMYLKSAMVGNINRLDASDSPTAACHTGK